MSNKDGDSHTTPRESFSILCYQDYKFCFSSAGSFFDIELVKAESFAENICSVAYVAKHVANNISLMIDRRKCRLAICGSAPSVAPTSRFLPHGPDCAVAIMYRYNPRNLVHVPVYSLVG